MRYELTIPAEKDLDQSHLVEVDAANWLGALREGMLRLGRPVPAAGKLLCEVRQDGVIAVRDLASGAKVHIRPVKAPSCEVPVEPPTVAAPPPKVLATMGYLQAQIESRLGAHAALPQASMRLAPSVRTGAHPCLVLPRFELDRRLGENLRCHSSPNPEHSNPVCAPREPQVEVVSSPDMEQTNPEGNRSNEENRRPRTLTALRIDVKALRQAVAAAHLPTAPENGNSPLPDGFEWLADPLEAALASAPDANGAMDRALRLLLAATPSRVAGVALREQTERPELRLLCAVGMGQSRLVGRTCGRAEGLFAACLEYNLAVVVGRDTEPFTTSHVSADLGYEPPNSVVAAVGTDGPSLGVLFVADSLGVPAYRSEDLLVCGHFARALGLYLTRIQKS